MHYCMPSRCISWLPHALRCARKGAAHRGSLVEARTSSFPMSARRAMVRSFARSRALH